MRLAIYAHVAAEAAERVHVVSMGPSRIEEHAGRWILHNKMRGDGLISTDELNTPDDLAKALTQFLEVRESHHRTITLTLVGDRMMVIPSRAITAFTIEQQHPTQVG